MTACTSFVDTLRSTPRTISVPSSEATCRFLISSRDNACDDLSLLFPRAREGPRDSPSVAAALRLTLLGDRAILGPMPGNIGWQGALLIILVLLLVFGPKRLPEMGRSLGRGMREFKDSISGNDRDDDEQPQLTQPTPTATAPMPPDAA